MKKRAILSVFDKTGIVEFARGLHGLGYEIVSTGSTGKAVAAAGIPVVNISDITGYPECLDGRVKTLHPAVHAGILAMRDNPEHMQTIDKLLVYPIDVVAVNLYPFKATISKPNVTLAEAIENIDIGGPSMLRSAAKNWRDVTVLVDPADYGMALEGLTAGGLTAEQRLALSAKVFSHTAAYDALIAAYLSKAAGLPQFPAKLTLTFEKHQEMRYGENPHQNAALYREPVGTLSHTVLGAEQLHGKEMSFCNVNDANGALDLLKEFDEPCAVAVKHANPCGVGIGGSIAEAYQRAQDADPVSIFGGIVALNRTLDAETAEAMLGTVLDIIIAPDYADDALEILKKRKNTRLLKLPGIAEKYATILDMKKVAGGLLLQELDTQLLDEAELKCVTARKPTEEEMNALRFAWKLVKHTKSNAIVLTDSVSSIGIGPGQVNRVGALEIAIRMAGDRAKGSALASDAFFPFDDSVRLAAAAGVTAIIQPGGSLRDEDSIKACDELGLAMLFTGMRHFKH